MNNYVVPNLSKACQILKLLAERPQGVSATEIETLVDTPRTTTFRILKTLCSEQMAEKRGKFFFAGSGLVKTGLDSLRSLEIRSLAIPLLNRLAMETGFTSHLAVPVGYQSMILEVHDSPNPVRVASRPGTVVPLYCSSTGKVFLAYRFANRLDDYFSDVTFEKHTPNTLVTLAEMEPEIKKIQQQGYAVDDQEFHKDIRCLAAPVKNDQGQIVSAIGVTGPVTHFTHQMKPDVAVFVKKAAGELSVELGHNS